MSWLNLNDSLNSLKGQISNFANTVLSDEDQGIGTSTFSEIEELRKLCKEQQETINQLKKQSTTFNHNGNTSVLPNDEFLQNPADPWSWNISSTNKIENSKTEELISDLKLRIAELENEKKELTSNLVLLDSEHQLNTEKLINMKNDLQRDFDNLEDKYSELKEEKESLLKTLNEYKTKLEDLEVKPETSSKNDDSCTKCEELLKENQNFVTEVEKLNREISVLKSNNATLQKILDDTKNANDGEFHNLQEKLKLLESENKILVSELKKATQSLSEFERKAEIDAENCKKLAFILEGYEQQVSALKDELNKKEDTAKLKTEVEELRKQLDEKIADKEQTHIKYINILTENMKRYVDCNKVSENFKNSETEIDPQMSEFNHQVESIVNILVDLKTKCESLEKELYNVSQEKTNLLAEKNHEIEKLLQNSEILSQEVITKSQTIKDYENECSELVKNNDMLINELKILKNNTGLQTISESNEDNILLLESQLENANKKIEELEQIIAQKENATVEEYSLESDFEQLKVENNTLKKEIEFINKEKENLSSTLEKIRSDFENTEYQYTEMNVNMESLKEELKNQKEEFGKLTKEKTELERCNEDIRSDLNVVREKLLLEEDARKNYENQIRNLTEKLQNAKMSETSLKLQYDTINKELIGMTEAKLTAEANLQSTVFDLSQCRGELGRLSQENEELTKKLDENSLQTVNLANADYDNLKQSYDVLLEEKNSLNCTIHTLKQKIQELESSKNELANVIITKHQESVSYHNEIQRLSQILNTEVEKNRFLESKVTEIEKLADQNNFLRQKCEVLAQNLLEEQNKVQQILAEHSAPSEKEQILSKKLERLQTHLIEVEEHYTQELLRAEEKNSELQAKVSEIELREKNSSTMYTSVSIRANQQVETLQNQLQLITNQRDELRKKISDAEDYASKQEAALTNLQFVLEQFQKDREQDIQKETERIRRQITAEKKVQEELRKEISGLQSQLDENKNALLAASRLSDQLEQSKSVITTLKSEVSQLKDSLRKSEERLQKFSSQTDGKVDKSLIKNLIIGFITTNNNLNKDQLQILKIIATVLDFNQQDHEKVKLNKPQQGWLSSFLAPQTSQNITQESLSQAFVKFLENESKPRQVPSLLNNNEEVTKSRKSSTSSRQSPSVLSEIVLPTFADFAQNRNSSSILKDVLKDNS